MIIVVMGVSGSGKSTVGKLLAQQLSCQYFEADDFHPEENVKKMSESIPLSDLDRKPWLDAIAEKIKCVQQETVKAVFTCSALKHSYRECLRKAAPGKVRFVFLDGPKELINSRIQERQSHFMPADLLDSQLQVLEIPRDALIVDIRKEPVVLVNEIVTELKKGDATQ